METILTVLNIGVILSALYVAGEAALLAHDLKHHPKGRDPGTCGKGDTLHFWA